MSVTCVLALLRCVQLGCPQLTAMTHGSWVLLAVLEVTRDLPGLQLSTSYADLHVMRTLTECLSSKTFYASLPDSVSSLDCRKEEQLECTHALMCLTDLHSSWN